MGNPLEKGQLKKSAIKDQAVIPKSTCHSESTQQRLASVVKFNLLGEGNACDASFWIMISLSMIDFPELKLWGQGVNFDRRMWPNHPLQLSQAVQTPSYGSQASLSPNEGSQRKAVQSTAYPPGTHAVPLGKET